MWSVQCAVYNCAPWRGCASLRMISLVHLSNALLEADSGGFLDCEDLGAGKAEGDGAEEGGRERRDRQSFQVLHVSCIRKHKSH